MKPNIPARYPKTSFSTRLFLFLRWWLTPYDVMASALPSSGRILDWGCGHGLFCFALTTSSPHREVLGIDHDAARIALAQQAAAGMPKIQFETGPMTTAPSGEFQGIAMIDVMHYFETSLQKSLASQAFAALAKGGILIVREVNPEGGLASAWNRLYERIATRIGFTKAEKKGLHFRTQAGWQGLLSSVGFRVKARRCSSFIFADILYVCQKE